MAGTETGELFILDNYELKQTIDNAFYTGSYGQGPLDDKGKHTPAFNVSLIKPYPKGFFIASDTNLLPIDLPL